MKHSLLTLTFLLSCSAAQAGTVLFGTDAQSYKLNEVISFIVVGRDFEKPLAGFGLDLGFDHSILELQSVTVDSVWEFDKSEGQRKPGKAEKIGGASFSGVDGAIKFATIEFIAKGIGFSDLLLSNANDQLFAWADNEGSLVSPDFINAQVQVVPIPAAFWLMFSAVGSVLVFGRSKREY